MAARTKQPRSTESIEWQGVDAINREHEFDAQDDGFSIQEYADRYKLPRGTAEKRLKRLVAVGALVQGSRYVKTSVGLRKLRVFTLAPKAA